MQPLARLPLKLSPWTIGPGPFGVMLIEGNANGQHFRAQLFAVSHGFAFTDVGRIKLGEGKWLFP